MEELICCKFRRCDKNHGNYNLITQCFQNELKSGNEKMDGFTNNFFSMISTYADSNLADINTDSEGNTQVFSKDYGDGAKVHFVVLPKRENIDMDFFLNMYRSVEILVNMKLGCFLLKTYMTPIPLGEYSEAHSNFYVWEFGNPKYMEKPVFKRDKTTNKGFMRYTMGALVAKHEMTEEFSEVEVLDWMKIHCPKLYNVHEKKNLEQSEVIIAFMGVVKKLMGGKPQTITLLSNKSDRQDHISFTFEVPYLLIFTSLELFPFIKYFKAKRNDVKMNITFVKNETDNMISKTVVACDFYKTN